MIPPQLLALGGAALLIAGAAGGWQVRSWKCDAAISRTLKAAEKERARLQAIVETQSTSYERERSDATVTNTVREHELRTIYRDKVVPGECAVPDAAVGVLEQARLDANARITGEPRQPVPDDPAPADAAD